MPENATLLAELRRRYGEAKGEAVYWGMVGEAKGPFGPGGKYHYEHVAWAKRAGVAPLSAGKKKGRRSGRGATRPTASRSRMRR